MIYSVDFFDMTINLSPLAVSKYLEDTNWKQFETKRKGIKIYQYETEKIFEQVTVPMEKTLRDYKQTMYDTINKIAEIENKAVEQLMLYLLNPGTDILKIRLAKTDIEFGNILFDDAISLYENAKKLLAYTALDIINPKKIHYGRIDEAVQKFISKCRFGQTEIGSYVVSVVCPFAELTDNSEFKQLSIFSDEMHCANSLTRKVTNRLMSNIAVIKEKIDDGKTKSLMNYDDGISSNFFEALNGLNLYGDNTILEFTAEWSPVVKKNRCESNNIRITNDYYQPIKAVIDQMKECTNQTTEIAGKIKKLSAAPIVDNRKEGNVVVAYLGDDNRAKSVSVRLSKEDYENAVIAHQHGKLVRLIGEVKEKRPIAVMENALFSVLE